MLIIYRRFGCNSAVRAIIMHKKAIIVPINAKPLPKLCYMLIISRRFRCNSAVRAKIMHEFAIIVQI